MTNVDISFRYKGEPKEAEIFALAGVREVYGIRRLWFDRAASTLTVEYDATRLNGAIVTQLVRRSGLQLVEEDSPTTLASEPGSLPVVRPSVSILPAVRP